MVSAGTKVPSFHWRDCSGALPASDDVVEAILRFDQDAMVFETMQQVPLQMIILVHEERFYRENECIETQLRNFQPFGHESFPAALARLNVVIGETGDQDEDFQTEILLWTGMRYRFLMEHAIGMWTDWSIGMYNNFLPGGLLEDDMTYVNVRTILLEVWQQMEEIARSVEE